MKKSNIFLAIFCVMTVFAIGFVWYALNHPELSFSWSLTVTYTIYGIYLLTDIIMLVLSFVLRRK